MNQLLTPALDLAAMLLLAAMTPARGLRLFLALIALGFGIGVVNVLDEAVLFQLMPPSLALPAVTYSTAVMAVASALAVLVAGKALGRGAPPIALRLTPLRLLALVAAYVALYFVAGMLIFPMVKAFYADTRIPSLPVLLAIQAVRGAIYVAACIPLLRLGPRLAPLTLGLAVPIIAGFAPLAADNPLMPAQARAWHALEIGWSNFVFGALMALVLAPKRPAAAPV